MTHSYNIHMDASPNLRLENLLAAWSLNLAQESTTALENASGLSGGAAVALLALDEFLGDAHVGRLADVLGVTHSGAVRLVSQMAAKGLAERRPGEDRRRVEIRLTAAGRRRAAAARAARDAVIRQSIAPLDTSEAATLETFLTTLVETRVAARMEQRRRGKPVAAWWCRTCDFTACGRAQGRCPAEAAAGSETSPYVPSTATARRVAPTPSA